MTAVDFLTVFWVHIGKLQMIDVGKFDQHAEEIARRKLNDLIYMRR